MNVNFSRAMAGSHTVPLGVNYEADSWLHFGRHFEEGRRYPALVDGIA